MESLEAVAIWPIHASALPDSDGPISDGKDEEGYSVLWRNLAVVFAC